MSALIGYGIVSEDVIPELRDPEMTEEPKPYRPLRFQGIDLGSAPVRFDLRYSLPAQRLSSEWGLAFAQDSFQAEFKRLREADFGSPAPGFELQEGQWDDLESQRLLRSGVDGDQGFSLSAELRGHFDRRDRGAAGRMADSYPGDSGQGRRGGPGGQDGGPGADPASPADECVGAACANGESQEDEGGRMGRDTLPPDRLRDAPVTVPEPSSLALLGAALLGLGLLVWISRRG